MTTRQFGQALGRARIGSVTITASPGGTIAASTGPSFLTSNDLGSW